MRPMMRILVVSFLLAGVASAAQIDGVLMDKMCSASAVKEGQSFATKHDTKCALETACMRSGYGVFTADGKFLSFDTAGNTQAATALKATKKIDNLKVTVMGDVDGSTIKVANLKLQ